LRKLRSLTLKEEHRLTTFENRVLSEVFGHKKEKITGDWSKLNNEELHDI
jgi:hypothetical protein